MNNSPTINCPKCGAAIPLTEAIAHQMREQLDKELEKSRREQNAAFAARELKLTQEQARLEAQAKAMEAAVAKRLEAEREKLLSKAAEKAEEKIGLELRELRDTVKEQHQRLETARNAELNLLKQKRALEEARASLESEVLKRIEDERKSIASKARDEAVKAERLRLEQKELEIDGLRKQITALEQRANQSSMQAQGETLELSLESDLRAMFPQDEITEVKKGDRGADIVQRVRNPLASNCGTILWEAKRARNWSSSWITKLKEDQRASKAELAIIVSTCLPEGLRGIGQRSGIWVCEPGLACALAASLRYGLISCAEAKGHESGRADKMSLLYEYLCGHEFRQRIEAVVEAFKALREQVSAERTAFEKQWSEREHQLAKAIQHTAALYGSIQGIAGRSALPEVPILSLPGTPSPQAQLTGK